MSEMTFVKINGKLVALIDGKVVAMTQSRDAMEADAEVSTESENPVQNQAITQYVNQLMSAGLKYEIVEELPTEDIDTHTIYLVAAAESEQGNIYEEWLYVNNAWEQIGSTGTVQLVEANVQIPSGATTYDLSNLKVGDNIYNIKSYHTFNNSWNVTGTTEQFCSSIVDDTSAIAGMTYLGKLQCSDLPDSLVQGEAIVEVISEDANGKAIRITLTSVNTAPYHWEYNRAKVNGTYVNTGWQSFMLNSKKPIHFIKLTSTTLTEALRAEILSDDYFVILEYNNVYFYEKNKTVTNNNISAKEFETMTSAQMIGNSEYNGKLSVGYQRIIVSLNSLTIQQYSNSFNAIRAGDKDVNYGEINSKTSSSTNAAAGKVLTADGSGNAVWTDMVGGYIESTTITSGDDISSLTDLVANLTAHLPVTINDVVCRFQNEDNNVITYSTMSLVNSKLHVNLITFDKTTNIITFNQFDLTSST